MSVGQSGVLCLIWRCCRRFSQTMGVHAKWSPKEDLKLCFPIGTAVFIKNWTHWETTMDKTFQELGAYRDIEVGKVLLTEYPADAKNPPPTTF